MASAVSIPMSSTNSPYASRSPSSESDASEASSPTSTASYSESPGAECWLLHAQRKGRESLLSSSFAKVEHTSVETCTRDGNPRIVAYVKTSQGFDWNQDIFLPQSSAITIHNGLRRPETVHEIILTEEDRFLPS